MRSYSKEFSALPTVSIAKCPNCGKRGFHQSFTKLTGWIGMTFMVTDSQGTPLEWPVFYANKPIAGVPDDAHLQCRKCGYSFPIFDFTGTSFGSSSIVEVIETHRSETILGEDRLHIRNPSQATLTRRQNLEQKWTQSWDVEYEKATRTGTAANIKIQGLGELKTEIEAQIKSRYTNTESLSRTYTDEMTLTVPPNTDVGVTVIWKKIWQHGLFRLSDDSEVPFKVAVGLTYDTE